MAAAPTADGADGADGAAEVARGGRNNGLHDIRPPPDNCLELFVLKNKVLPPLHPEWSHIPTWVKPLLRFVYGTRESAMYNYRLELERQRRVPVRNAQSICMHRILTIAE